MMLLAAVNGPAEAEIGQGSDILGLKDMSTEAAAPAARAIASLYLDFRPEPWHVADIQWD